MKNNKELQDKIQEAQVLEQNLQNLLLQKQVFLYELNETASALEETEKTKDDIYKIVGQVMLKSKKQDIIKELEEKKEILNLRIKAIENQENNLKEKLEKIKGEIERLLKEKH